MGVSNYLRTHLLVFTHEEEWVWGEQYLTFSHYKTYCTYRVTCHFPPFQVWELHSILHMSWLPHFAHCTGLNIYEGMHSLTHSLCTNCLRRQHLKRFGSRKVYWNILWCTCMYDAHTHDHIKITAFYKQLLKTTHMYTHTYMRNHTHTYAHKRNHTHEGQTIQYTILRTLPLYSSDYTPRNIHDMHTLSVVTYTCT